MVIKQHTELVLATFVFETDRPHHQIHYHNQGWGGELWYGGSLSLEKRLKNSKKFRATGDCSPFWHQPCRVWFFNTSKILVKYIFFEAYLLLAPKCRVGACQKSSMVWYHKRYTMTTDNTRLWAGKKKETRARAHPYLRRVITWRRRTRRMEMRYWNDDEYSNLFLHYFCAFRRWDGRKEWWTINARRQ